MQIILAIISPLVGIAAKWIIIGRYKPGRYPLWGSMCVWCSFLALFMNIQHLVVDCFVNIIDVNLNIGIYGGGLSNRSFKCLELVYSMLTFQ
jgi:hypothetical protein